MTFLKQLATGVALGAIASTAVLPAYAETPANMLVIAHRIDDIITLDPQEVFELSGTDYTRNVYSKLVNLDPSDLSAGYQPQIATSWEVSEDGRTITFQIRDDVKFHSGNKLTAKDIEFSLRRGVILNKTPSFILTQFGFTPENVEDTIVAVDDTTFRMTTDKRYALSFVLNCLTASIAGIVDSKLVMENAVDGDMGNGWLKTNSAGSGPYKLQSWQPNESIIIQANADYFDGAPAMQRVIVRHVQESASQRLLLERGDIDVARNLNPEDVAGAMNADGVEITSELRGQIMYWALSQKHDVLSDPKVVEAAKYLVDYEGMQDSFLKGQWKVHQAFLPRTYLGELDETPYSLDVDKAKALLAEAGHGDGFEIEVGVREAQERIEIAQSLQNTFAQANIKLNITVGTAAQILGRYRARELDMYLGAWGPDYPDPHTNAATFAMNADNSDDAGLTGVLAWRNAWDIPAMTEQTAAAVIENDRDARAQMYRDIQRDHQRTSPFGIMFQRIEQTGLRDNVNGFSIGGATTRAAYWKVTKE